MKKIFCIIFILLFVFNHLLNAEEIKIAVATNFSATIKKIVNLYEEQTGDKVVLIFGSTGKLYAQIKNGAPFDGFLAADSKRPKLLEDEKVALKNSRFTYAIGKLVLWSPAIKLGDSAVNVLTSSKYNHIAIANPKLAPYGMAAKEVLIKLNQFLKLSKKIVKGENIGQAFQFIKSGNAELGFCALSQIIGSNIQNKNYYWIVPAKFYSPIKQQAILLNKKKSARAFFDFLRSPDAKKIIHDFGYDTP
ncbi:MAG: molybdate ABC transporter substrate-binding protein [Melioribacteraceae bacterium]|nr:molybdate ABC transporter substrate-binding protein [Melioribacteraceae bacterium]